MPRLRTVFTSTVVGAAMTGLAGCAGSYTLIGEGSGSVPYGTHIGTPTNVCVIEGDYIHAYYDLSLNEVRRDVGTYTTNGKCGTRAKPLGLCFTTTVTGARPLYTGGHYRGDVPTRMGNIRIPCPAFIDFYPPNGYSYGY